MHLQLIKTMESCTYSRQHRVIQVIVAQNRQKQREGYHQHANQELTLPIQYLFFSKELG